MKKYVFIALAVLFIVGGGGTYVATHQNQNSQPAPSKMQSSTRSSRQQSSSSLTSQSTSQSSSQSASQSTSAQNSSSNKAQSQSQTDSSHQGEAKAGDHTVNGKVVSDKMISILQERLNSLGFNPEAWSPQDVINLYRYCSQKGHSDPGQITKQDVESYLKK